MELWQMINDIQIELSRQIQELKEKGRIYAQAYRDYRIYLAKELVRLKLEKVPVTIAYDIARGLEYVANAKYQELTTEADYKSCQEAINVNKLKLKIFENQYEREWGQAKRM